jgi:hypothetical protein
MKKRDAIFLRPLLMTSRDILMIAKLSYNELERKIKKLEKEALKYMRREREFTAEQKQLDYSHLKRTISLMKINGELNKEIKEIKSAGEEKLEQISQKLNGRIKELNCLYDISRFRESSDFSLDGLLQEMVDFIPPACQHSENTCARIIFDGYEFTTKKFFETRWKQSFNISVNNTQIGQLEVFRLEKKTGLRKALFLEEEKSLIGAIAESISRIVEREWAEAEIRKCRKKIEELIKQPR